MPTGWGCYEIAAALERFLRSTPIYRAAHGAALGRSAIQLRPRATHREDLSPRWLDVARLRRSDVTQDVTTPSASRQDHKVVRVQLAVLLLPLLRVREAQRVSRGSRGTGRRQAQGVAAWRGVAWRGVAGPALAALL